MVEFNLHGDDADYVIAAVNQGIDGYLEACFLPGRGDRYNRRGRYLNCEISRKSMLVLIRRLREAGHDKLAQHLAVIDSMDTFTSQYIVTALWSSCDDDDVPLNENYGPNDLAPETLEKIKTDCDKFQAENAQDIDGRQEQAGHDFWLTRCHHGCGFWDGNWPKEAGDRLTAACKGYPEVNLYVGDDRLIHGE